MLQYTWWYGWYFQQAWGGTDIVFVVAIAPWDTSAISSTHTPSSSCVVVNTDCCFIRLIWEYCNLLENILWGDAQDLVSNYRLRYWVWWFWWVGLVGLQLKANWMKSTGLLMPWRSVIKLGVLRSPEKR